MKITYDLTKRALTLSARGLDMANTADVFANHLLTIPDNRKDYGEERFITVGYLADRMVVVIWTMRGDTRRIISLRKANEREQEAYRPRL